MSLQNTLKSLLIILSLAIPYTAFAADVLDDVGDGISDTANAVGDAASDTAITTSVKAKLALEKDIPMLDVSVTTNKGVVTLDGKVPTSLQAERIIQIASSVSGVTDVDASRLAVEDSTSFFSDALITAKAKGRIMQLSSDGKISSGYNLTVETTNGVVHIFGTVKNSSDKDVISNSVASISDVKEVKTNIDVD